VIARVVSKREHVLLSEVATVAAALLLLLIAADDRSGSRFVPLAVDGFGLSVVASLYAVAALGPWLRFRARARVTTLQVEPGALRVGGDLVRAADVTAAKVAAAARGRSVALARGGRVMFLEVESDADAASVLAPFGGAGVGGDLPLVAGRPKLRVLSGIVSFAILMTGAIHIAAAFHLASSDTKWSFGIATVLLGLVSAAVTVARGRALRTLAPQNAELGRSAYDEHVRLHLDPVDAAAEERPRTRVGGLSRGDEPASAWLARLDAMPAVDGAYRGDAATRDILWATLADEHASSCERAAAARLLCRRFHEDASAVVGAVDDPDVRVRVEAAMDDTDDAAVRLEALGPVFRAR
jgi:hypothetical protein